MSISRECLLVAVLLLAASPVHAQTITAGRWIALPTTSTATAGAPPGSIKHMSPGYNPVNHRLYFTAGDYPGFGLESYKQQTWSLSVSARLADPTNTLAGWTLEYPYCGPANQIQPKWPDFGGFKYDTTRNVFWWIVGVEELSTACTGETVVKQDDAATSTHGGFSFGHLMQFDPVSKLWSDIAGLSLAFTHVWDTVYDATGDTLVTLQQGTGAGDVIVNQYNMGTQLWSRPHVSATPPTTKTLYGIKGYAGFDQASRTLYYIEPYYKHLMAYHIATAVLNDLGALPSVVKMAGGDQPKVAWDANHSLLYWHNHAAGEFFAYHPGTATWETLVTHTQLAGVEACNANVLAYDPDQDVLVAWGDVWGAACSCNGIARPYLFMYRYGG